MTDNQFYIDKLHARIEKLETALKDAPQPSGEDAMGIDIEWCRENPTLAAAEIEQRRIRIEKLERALRAIANDDDKTLGMCVKVACAALAPEQEK